ncbi:hypothetical protein ACQRXC_29355 (plasmid) [Niallia taxi]|uniref:hypothetical protein n=1 Tax=Niallia taxi TaxID=2499688 RepID=UPI003F5F4DD2
MIKLKNEWKNEWNKLNDEEKRSFIKTFKKPLYLLISIIILYLILEYNIAPVIVENMK